MTAVSGNRTRSGYGSSASICARTVPSLSTFPALPTPSQLPEVFNKLQELRLDVRHRLTGRLAATLSYEYEPSRIFDFAFDPSVINGIVQPSTLVLGYVYRPYTAHTARLGILYRW